MNQQASPRYCPSNLIVSGRDPVLTVYNIPSDLSVIQSDPQLIPSGICTIVLDYESPMPFLAIVTHQIRSVKIFKLPTWTNPPPKLQVRDPRSATPLLYVRLDLIFVFMVRNDIIQMTLIVRGQCIKLSRGRQWVLGLNSKSGS